MAILAYTLEELVMGMQRLNEEEAILLQRLLAASDPEDDNEN